MKTRLLRKLGKNIILVYIPKIGDTEEYWQVERVVNDSGFNHVAASGSYKEMLKVYLYYRHSDFSSYIRDKKIKHILP